MLIDHRTIFLGCSKMNVEEKFTALPIELQMKVVTHYVPLLEENCHHYLRARQTNRFWNKAICDNLQHHRCMRLPHIFKDSCFSFYRLLCTKPYETRTDLQNLFCQFARFKPWFTKMLAAEKLKYCFTSEFECFDKAAMAYQVGRSRWPQYEESGYLVTLVERGKEMLVRKCTLCWDECAQQEKNIRTTFGTDGHGMLMQYIGPIMLQQSDWEREYLENPESKIEEMRASVEQPLQQFIDSDDGRRAKYIPGRLFVP